MKGLLSRILKLFKSGFLFIGITISFTISLQGQNNGIFNGSDGTGYTFALITQSDNSSIFFGSSQDGYDIDFFTQEAALGLYAGGTDDGYSIAYAFIPSNNDIYKGGIDDGYTYQHSSIDNQNSIFAGGNADGYDLAFGNIASSNEIFAGGIDDGYHTSGISKLIWTGEQSSDWLMADNWNVRRTPLFQDEVIIPDVETTFPFLTGKLLIGHVDTHTYTCRSIQILSGANVSGNENAWFVNYGLFVIFGLLELNDQADNTNQNLGNGVIHVLNNGELNIFQ